jgi:hypothetical protein
MKKYFVALEFPPPDNCIDGAPEFVEVEAETEDEAKDKARKAVMHHIRVNRIVEIPQKQNIK